MSASEAVPSTDLDLFRAVLQSAKEAIGALWAPSKAAISESKSDFGGFMQQLATPLLRVELEHFKDRVEELAQKAPSLLLKMKRIMESSAFRAWEKQAVQQADLQALKPDWENRDAALLLMDVDERTELLEKALRSHQIPRIHGIRQPSRAELEAHHIHYVASVAALVTATYNSPGNFNPENILRAYELCTRCINFQARILGLKPDRVVTSRDLSRQQHILDAIDSEQDAHRAHVQAQVENDREQFFYWDE